MARPDSLPFEFVGGHPALDFTNTVSWGREGLGEERFDSYARLLEWARTARLPVDVRSLRARAAGNPAAAARVIADARVVRAELHDLFAARATGGSLPDALLRRLNDRLTSSLGALHLHAERGRTGPRAAWRLRDPRNLEGPVQWVMWEAATLLASGEPIKICASPGCGWVYIDRSRRGNRRWCDMAVCGARHKARRYYRRQRSRRRAGGPHARG